MSINVFFVTSNSINVFAYTTLNMLEFAGSIRKTRLFFQVCKNQSIASLFLAKSMKRAKYWYTIIIVLYITHAYIKCNFNGYHYYACPVGMMHTFPYVISLLLHWCAIQVCYIIKLVHDNTNGAMNKDTKKLAKVSKKICFPPMHL